MQDTFNMLTRWAVGLQAYEFSVKHRPGKPNVIPDILSPSLEYEQSERVYNPTMFVPICRNTPDTPSLRTRAPQNPCQLEMDNMTNMAPVMGDSDIFEDLAHVNAINVFTIMDPAKLREAQRGDSGPYFK